MLVDGRRFAVMLMVILSYGFAVWAEPPMVSYIFPAGGQRGTRVDARVGGCNLNEAPVLFWSDAGVNGPATLSRTETVWFEGPVIPQPPSQQREDYPRDYLAPLVLSENAPSGLHAWRVATSQGATAAWGFIVGRFTEVVEQEVEGNSPAIPVTLPVTINGRIFPREDVDAWSFSGTAGQVITCHVATSSFGSPLDARVTLSDATGRVLAESVPAGDATPPLRFKLTTTGDYHVQIHDVGFQGLQNSIYRLTLTTGPVLEAVYPLGGRRGTTTRFQLFGSNLHQTEMTCTLPELGAETLIQLPDAGRSFGEVRVDVDEFEELLESEAGEGSRNVGQQFAMPCILNGRIRTPGEEDDWGFVANKGVEYELDVRAARLGSPLDPVISICDSSGKTIQEVDDGSNLQTDARLRWVAPDDGNYQVRIRDRLSSRGGDQFAYRIRATSAANPDFSLKLVSDFLNIEQGQSANVKVLVERGPGFQEPIELHLEGLPAGLTMTSPSVIAANQPEIQLTLKAEKQARAITAALRISGTAKVGEQQIKRTAVTVATSSGPDAVPVRDSDSALWVSIAIPTPFKFVGVFESKYISRGSVLVRKYRIERNGFEGPLQVQLADRQGRHLQGVTARPVFVEADQNEFEFAVALPPWMEVGRTCRSTLSITGQIKDDEGQPHTISYSSNDQHNQMIALVATGRLAIQLSKTNLTAQPGVRTDIPISIQRNPDISGPVTLEMISPKSLKGVNASSVTIGENQSAGMMTLEFGPELKGIGIHPIVIRATTQDDHGLPVTAEAKLTFVDQIRRSE